MIRQPAVLSLLMLASVTAGFAQASNNAEPPPRLLIDVDHRQTTSMDGEWHAIVDPYGTGLYTFHQKLRTDGYFKNLKSETGDGPLEYNFEHSPTLRVPGDWNTQRDSLFLYEGPMWHEKDFTYKKKPGTRLFFHLGAANYRSYIWVNGKKA